MIFEGFYGSHSDWPGRGKIKFENIENITIF